MGINVGAFVGSLKYMIEGWAGIFIVMGIIIAAIKGLNILAEKIDETTSKKDA